MQAEMTHKERILAAIEHRTIDRIPIDYWGTPEATNKSVIMVFGFNTGAIFFRS